MTARAVLAGVAIALVAGIAGGALALAVRGDGDERSRRHDRRARRRDAPAFDPVALYANARHGVVTIEANFGVDDVRPAAASSSTRAAG